MNSLLTASKRLARTVSLRKRARWCSFLSRYIRYPQDLEFLPSTPHPAVTSVLGSFSSKKSRLEDISEGVQAFTCEDPLPTQTISSKTRTFYFRSFYPSLLDHIRSFPRSVLIGNPGTGKSMFQFYYLARILRPDLFSDHKLQSPPKVILRQVALEWQIYLCDEGVGFSVPNADPRVVRAFDPKQSLYLFEPLALVMEPHFAGVETPTLATVSPNVGRYKEFVKNGAKKLYMPTWALEDLLAVGNHMKAQGSISEAMIPHFSAKEIEARFNEFGGIIRYVLPEGLHVVEEARKDRREAVQRANLDLIMQVANIEDPDVSHHLAQYVVPVEGEGAFEAWTINFVNQKVVDMLESKLVEANLNQMITTLIHNDGTPSYLVDACPKIYENVVARRLTGHGGIHWKRKPSDTQDWEDFDLALGKLERRVPSSFQHMQEGVLYFPTKTNYVLADLFFKQKGQLVAIQITRKAKGTRQVTQNQWDLFQKGVTGVPSPIKLVLCPSPQHAETAQCKFETDTLPQHFKCEIWKVPTNYTAHFEE